MLAVFIAHGWTWELEQPNFRRSVLETARALTVDAAGFDAVLAKFGATPASELPRGETRQLFYGGKRYQAQRDFVLDALERKAATKGRRRGSDVLGEAEIITLDWGREETA